MDSVGSLDSSRDLQLIYTKSFVNRLHLVLQISKILRFLHFCVYVVGTKHDLIDMAAWTPPQDTMG